jgi:hypothetical protein
MTLSEMIDYASETAETLFNRDGYLNPLWLGVCEDGTHFIMPAPPVPDKDLAAILVRIIFKEKRVVRCLFVDECWFISFPSGWPEKKVKAEMRKWFKNNETLEDHPHRREAVIFQGEDNTQGILGAQRAIIRPEKGRAYLGPLKMAPMVGAEGRFVGMLPNLSGLQH